MRRLDRYIVAQLLAAFAFFGLIFTGVIWLTQSLRLIDTVISAGESAVVFAEFSILLLPRVLSMVLPLSALSAAIHVLNRLYSEAELVVMQTSGQSPLALARPVLAFGALAAVMTWAVTLWLAPAGAARLEDRRIDIRSELANALLVEGQFLNPAPGITLYLRDTSATGEMAGIFLQDERDPDNPVTYSAERALLMRDGTKAGILMSKGVALSLDQGSRGLAQVRFDEFLYDISILVAPTGSRVRRPAELALAVLLNPPPEVAASARSPGALAAEAHDRIVAGLNALALPLVALAAMMTGGYRRQGFRARIFWAVAAAVLLVSLGIAARGQVEGTAALWPLAYLPFALGLAASLWMLIRAGQPGRRSPARVPA
jgi:lipopolysaccharide export system permease protein